MKLLTLRSLFFSLLIVLFSLQVQAQEEQIRSAALLTQFDEMIQTSETFKEYKVIRLTKLATFREQLMDSISTSKRAIAASQNALQSLQTEKTKLEDSLESTNARLGESERTNNQIGFLGLKLNKAAYNSLVWGIIAILAFAVFTVYFRARRALRKSKEASDELVAVESKLKETQFKAQEVQMKLKRELQTALNRLESSY